MTRFGGLLLRSLYCRHRNSARRGDVEKSRRLRLEIMSLRKEMSHGK